MPQYSKIDETILRELRSIVGEDNVLTDAERLQDYSHDESCLDEIAHFPDVVVRPRNTDEVSRIARLCNDRRTPLTVRGGGTGLCGGCVPVFGGIVLSFENMRRVLDVDAKNLTVTVEAGLTLLDLYSVIEEKGLFFPPHPGDASATLGGVIATNAGGARAVKYGVVRNFVKGLEVVLANGEVIHPGGKFIKDSSGYSLIHLLVGSEGTLGIVTRATLALMAPPQATATLVVPYDTLHDAIDTVPAILQNKILPMAVEFLDRECAFLGAEHLGKVWPCVQGNYHLMILLDGSTENELMILAERIGEICLAHRALDVFVADTRARQREILDIRSGLYETLRDHMLEDLDIAVPRARIAEFVDGVDAVAQECGLWLPTYGHAADGNVHIHVMRARRQDGEWRETKDWQTKYKEVRRRLHELGKTFEGIPSGEHGIGFAKKEYLASYLSPRQIGLMLDIKKVFDPRGILNPGKIFDFTD